MKRTYNLNEISKEFSSPKINLKENKMNKFQTPLVMLMIHKIVKKLPLQKFYCLISLITIMNIRLRKHLRKIKIFKD